MEIWTLLYFLCEEIVFFFFTLYVYFNFGCRRKSKSDYPCHRMSGCLCLYWRNSIERLNWKDHLQEKIDVHPW